MPRRFLLAGFLVFYSSLSPLLPFKALADTPSPNVAWRDVSPSHWAYQTLITLAEKYDLKLGLSPDMFKGEQALTRYEAAALALQILERVRQAAPLADTEQADLTEIETLLHTEISQLSERVDTLEDQSALQSVEQLELAEQMQQFQKNLPFRLFGSLALRSCSMGETVEGGILGTLFQVRLGAGIQGQVHPDWQYELRILSTENDSYNLSWFPFGGTHIPRSLITLDRFFINWRPLRASGWQPQLDIQIGKALNPLAETQLLFDEDVSFTGLQQQIQWKNPLPHWHSLELSLNENVVLMEDTFITSSLWAAKAASEWRWNDLHWRSAISYSHYLGSDRLAPYNFNQGYLGPFSQRNRLTSDNQGFTSQFQLLNLFSQVGWQGIDNWPLHVFGDYVHNFGARDQNQGWLVGLKAGQQKKPATGN
ncbi:MAG: putative porin [Candidatus Sericytochromatia bacterium]|nr:putative porin [Candidatus Sericytochromatia bacterium]